MVKKGYATEQIINKHREGKPWLQHHHVPKDHSCPPYAGVRS